MNADFWSGKRVLVTGAGGFLGRWMTRHLESAGCVVGTHDIDGSQQFDGDLSDWMVAYSVVSAFQPQVTIHLAGMPGVAACNEIASKAWTANANAASQICSACRLYESTLVIISSNHVYGHQHHQPTNEDAPLNGRGIYAATKAAADIMAQAYGKTYKLPVGIARITNTYGGDDHHAEHIVTSTIKACLKGERPVIRGSGDDRKGFAYVKDTVEGILAVAEGVAGSESLRGEAFNIVPNEAWTVKQLVARIIALTGAGVEPLIEKPLAPKEVEHLDNTKARHHLGWSPRYDLNSGLRETIEWYREHAEVKA